MLLSPRVPDNTAAQHEDGNATNQWERETSVIFNLLDLDWDVICFRDLSIAICRFILEVYREWVGLFEGTATHTESNCYIGSLTGAQPVNEYLIVTTAQRVVEERLAFNTAKRFFTVVSHSKFQGCLLSGYSGLINGHNSELVLLLSNTSIGRNRITRPSVTILIVVCDLDIELLDGGIRSATHVDTIIYASLLTGRYVRQSKFWIVNV
ncbi:hypothetical protein SAMN05216388_104811 [Halorientalis persicus]|uniref:Uncharacterized protein n=1 Tax=Halorientalis persicus TaxID=1367881 RepID=A0A1H8W5F5_9EURY|nr:hypothetical protein SAMN05216388_104811 [Halorientalis persicus]